MKRQPNQYRILSNESDITEGAEQLLQLIKTYQYVYNVTNQQYAYLMEISLRNTRKYISELIKKGYIEVYPNNRRSGQGKANNYKVLKDYVSSQLDNQ